MLYNLVSSSDKEYNDKFITYNIKKIVSSILSNLYIQSGELPKKKLFSYNKFDINQSPLEYMCNNLELVVIASSKIEASFIFWVSRSFIELNDLAIMAEHALDLYTKSKDYKDSVEEYFIKVVSYEQDDSVNEAKIFQDGIVGYSYEYCPSEWKIAKSLHDHEYGDINERIIVSLKSLINIFKNDI